MSVKPWMLALVATPLMACEGRPERESLETYEPATVETGAQFTPNNCNTLTHEFAVQASGYIAGDFDGYGYYEYKSAPEQRTTIVLRPCEIEETDAVFSLTFWGTSRIEANTYPVSQEARAEGGFDFSFIDDELGLEVNCDDQPTGTVEITRANFNRVQGRFDITSRCKDIPQLEDLRRPQETRWVGTFDAVNLGTE